MSYAEMPADLFEQLGLNLDTLIALLPDGEGGGIDMRYRPEMDALVEARREDDDTDQGIWQTATKKADWSAVIRAAIAILERQSKDLQVAVWLAHALTSRDGLNGLTAGLELLARMTAELWPVLWPRPDGDDLEPRMTPYFWIDNHLTVAVMRLEVTAPPEGSRDGLTFQQMVRARKLQQLAKNNTRAFSAAVADGEVSMEAMTAAVDQTEDDFYLDQRQRVRQALGALWRLSRALDRAAGGEAPSFSNLSRTLQDIERMFTQILTNRGLEEQEAEAVPDEQTTDELPSAVPVPAGPQFSVADGLPVIGDRRAAYALLDYAAEWLLDHEPHSPAPYLVKRAIAWEDLSLREVLTELMSHGANAETIFAVLGIGADGQAASARRRRGGQAALE